ncbi:hypothetical protein N7461_007804 [Penicillium sp. DV-2018c]|nr:hypothetical protein N7461_007804 [Penicillium sp. DV-2018c]
MDDTPLATLSLTHVHYNPNDKLSFASAWLALVPQALCVSYATLIWSTREVEVIMMFVGQMASEVLNWTLKRVIKEERPQGIYGKGYGMPSSHAQFMTFFSVYLTLFLLFRHSQASASSYPNVAVLLRILVMLGLCIGAAAVAASRIYLNYHTPKQVFAGCAAGFWIEWTLDTTISRLVRVRDLVVSEDLAEAGWQRWESQRLKRRGLSDGKKSE